MANTEFGKAWFEWLESRDGKLCMDGKAEGEYLKNRLWYAFSAGWTAAERSAAVGESSEK